MFGLNKLEATFRDAANQMKQIPSDVASTMGQAHRFECYGYYKQATLGDINTPQPHLLNQRDNAKWWAWKNVQGLTKEEAMEKYITTTEVFRKQQKH